jgi:PAS domain S-box-containing protein
MKPAQECRPPTLLIVEDDGVAADYLNRMIARRFPGCVIHLAEHGQRGMELFKLHSPDITITDINMPVLDGIQMAARIRSLEPDAHIIAVTAKSDTQHLLDAIKVGINRYVLKPIALEKLFDSIEDCIARVTLKRQVKAQDDHIRKLSLAVEQSTNMVMIADSGGSIEYVNPRFSEITGYAPAEIKGVNLRALMTGAAPPDTSELLWNTVSRGLRWRGEFVHRRKNGELFFVETSIAPLSSAQEKGTYFVAVMQDISERKLSEQRLRESEETLRALLDLMPAGVSWSDSTGTIGYLNSGFVKLFGFTAQEVPTVTEWFARAYPDPGCRERASALWRAAADRTHGEKAPAQMLETEVTCKDGSLRQVLVNTQVIGSLRIAIFTEVTGRDRRQDRCCRESGV